MARSYKLQTELSTGCLHQRLHWNLPIGQKKSGPVLLVKWQFHWHWIPSRREEKRALGARIHLSNMGIDILQFLRSGWVDERTHIRHTSADSQIPELPSLHGSSFLGSARSFALKDEDMLGHDCTSVYPQVLIVCFFLRGVRYRIEHENFGLSNAEIVEILRIWQKARLWYVANSCGRY